MRWATFVGAVLVAAVIVSPLIALVLAVPALAILIYLNRRAASSGSQDPG